MIWFPKRKSIYWLTLFDCSILLLELNEIEIELNWIETNFLLSLTRRYWLANSDCNATYVMSVKQNKSDSYNAFTQTDLLSLLSLTSSIPNRRETHIHTLNICTHSLLNVLFILIHFNFVLCVLCMKVFVFHCVRDWVCECRNFQLIFGHRIHWCV